MHIYHDKHKKLPDHAIYSPKDGTPLLSWRVALLSDIEHEGRLRLVDYPEAVLPTRASA